MRDLSLLWDGGVWRIRYRDDAGIRRRLSTGTTIRAEAEVVLRRLQQRLDEGRTGAPLTVAAYAERWIERRRARAVRTVKDDEARLRDHVLPRLGSLPIAEVRLATLRDFAASLSASTSAKGRPLAPRTRLHVLALVEHLLRDAHADELVPRPVALPRGERPRKADVDPAWRAGAVLTRDEVEAVLSDDRIRDDRRALWALLLLTGMRLGEATELRWSDYDAAARPLGRLTISRSRAANRAAVSGTKTGSTRECPVHPILAAELARWRLSGWEAWQGRPPQPSDLVCPGQTGRHRGAGHTLRAWHDDLATLGLRERRIHDCRRTLVTLARADGARVDLLRWATHGPGGTIVDLYTSPPWDALCEAIGCVRVEVRRGVVVALRREEGT